MKLNDLTGQRFERLTVMQKAPTQTNMTYWLCQCDCGETVSVRRDHLLTGNTVSCGCFRVESIKATNTKHGGRAGTGERIYNIWCAMRQRCRVDKNYAGRGITICKEWASNYPAFRKWALSHGYRDDLTIDRINNGKGYEPSNCRWATRHEQNLNTRRSKKARGLC